MDPMFFDFGTGAHRFLSNDDIGSSEMENCLDRSDSFSQEMKNTNRSENSVERKVRRALFLNCSGVTEPSQPSIGVVLADSTPSPANPKTPSIVNLVSSDEESSHETKTVKIEPKETVSEVDEVPDTPANPEIDHTMEIDSEDSPLFGNAVLPLKRPVGTDMGVNENSDPMRTAPYYNPAYPPLAEGQEPVLLAQFQKKKPVLGAHGQLTNTVASKRVAREVPAKFRLAEYGGQQHSVRPQGMFYVEGEVDGAEQEKIITGRSIILANRLKELSQQCIQAKAVTAMLASERYREIKADYFLTQCGDRGTPIPRCVSEYHLELIDDNRLIYMFDRPFQVDPVKIGEGGSGFIKLALLDRTRLVAVKQPKRLNEKTKQDMTREAQVTSWLCHQTPGSAHCFGLTHTGYMVLDLYLREHSLQGDREGRRSVYIGDCGTPVNFDFCLVSASLYDLLDGPPDPQHLDSLPPTCIAELFLDVALCLETCHRVDLCHSDIKEDNILVTFPYVREFPFITQQRPVMGKLADFGLAATEKFRHLIKKRNHEALKSSMKMLPPEMALNAATPWTKSADIWQLGRTVKKVTKWLQERGRPHLDFSPWQAFLDRMTAEDPKIRPCAHDVTVAFQYFSELTKHKQLHAAGSAVRKLF